MVHGGAESGAVGALEEWVKCCSDLPGTGSEEQDWRFANCDAPWRHRAGAAPEHVRKLPGQLRRSLTWDQGKEMHAHKRFTAATNVQVYFCDPRSPLAQFDLDSAAGGRGDLNLADLPEAAPAVVAARPERRASPGPAGRRWPGTGGPTG